MATPCTRGRVYGPPAAAGFDARLIGGATVIARHNGDTLRKEMDGALASSPDAIGLISWNEFSENSHVEPSRRYGSTSLRVIADIRDTPAPSIPDFNSDAAPATDGATGSAARRRHGVDRCVARSDNDPKTAPKELPKDGEGLAKGSNKSVCTRVVGSTSARILVRGIAS